jgi:hypothetical protein
MFCAAQPANADQQVVDPVNPAPSIHGYSVGRWEEDTLVVDVKGILPQVYLAVSEAVGIANNGDMSVEERYHLIGRAGQVAWPRCRYPLNRQTGQKR